MDGSSQVAPPSLETTGRWRLFPLLTSSAHAKIFPNWSTTIGFAAANV
jgi:hypothetical protein